MIINQRQLRFPRNTKSELYPFAKVSKGGEDDIDEEERKEEEETIEMSQSICQDDVEEESRTEPQPGPSG